LRKLFASILIIILVGVLALIVIEQNDIVRPDVPSSQTMDMLEEKKAVYGNTKSSIISSDKGNPTGSAKTKANNFSSRVSDENESTVTRDGSGKKIVLKKSAEMPGEIEIDGRKFKLVEKHEIDPDDIKMKRDGKSVRSQFPIPENVEGRKKKEDSDKGMKKEGE